jgi:succinate dehydrogenase / fumarate reductase cytochrome b subunit
LRRFRALSIIVVRLRGVFFKKAAMKRAFSLYGSSIGKKVAMGISGLLLVGFVVGHMVGNLKIYFGEEYYNAYAEALREIGHPLFGHNQFLWIARVVLLGAVLLHIWAALRLTLRARRARRQDYRQANDLSFSYASRTMRWGGVLVAGFIVYHILHLTTGTVHPGFKQGSVYRNVVAGFSQWPVALLYIGCMIPLCLHLYHGIWSATQTLGLDGPHVERWRRGVAVTIALIVALGNISVPVAVLAGWIG